MILQLSETQLESMFDRFAEKLMAKFEARVAGLPTSEVSLVEVVQPINVEGPVKVVEAVDSRKTRKLTDEGRARIVAAQKKRHASRRALLGIETPAAEKPIPVVEAEARASEPVAGIQYEEDPFIVLPDGHIQGKDGFIVPKNFTEFYEQYSSFITKFVRSKRWNLLHTVYSVEDMEQSLLIHLMNLCEGSKYREQGFTDIIQTFDPVSAHGASKWKFFHYVRTILNNHLTQLIRKSKHNPLDNVLDEGFFPEDGNSDVAHESWESTIVSAEDPEEFLAGVYVREFEDFVSKHNPELVPLLAKLQENSRYSDAYKSLGLSLALFHRAQRRLKVLFKCYTAARTVPEQRKIHVYKTPTPETELAYSV